MKISKLSLLSKPLDHLWFLTNINKKPNFQCIFVQEITKNRMFADFYIPRLAHNMKIAVQKNHLGVKFCIEKQSLYVIHNL